MDELLTIGRFGRLAGLSVGAPRHYDDLDLLRPAQVDRSSGYRLYRRDQLATARSIVRLRDLEVPLETIRDLLATSRRGRPGPLPRSTGSPRPTTARSSRVTWRHSRSRPSTLWVFSTDTFREAHPS